MERYRGVDGPRTPHRAGRVVPVPGAAGDAHARGRALRARPVDPTRRPAAVRGRRVRVRVASAPGAAVAAEGQDGAVRSRAPGVGRRLVVRPRLPHPPRGAPEPRRPGRARRTGPADPLPPPRSFEAAVGALRDRGPRGRSRRDPDEGASRDDRRPVGHAPQRGAVRPLAAAARAYAAARLGARARTVLAGPAARGHRDPVRAPGPGADERRGRGPAIARRRGARRRNGAVGVPQHPRHGGAARIAARRADRTEPTVRDRRRPAPAVQGDQGRAGRDGERRGAHGRGRCAPSVAPRTPGAHARPHAPRDGAGVGAGRAGTRRSATGSRRRSSTCRSGRWAPSAGSSSSARGPPT